jgi:hypothetical protein
MNVDGAGAAVTAPCAGPLLFPTRPTAVVRVRVDFGGRAPAWNRAGVQKAGAHYEIAMRAGQAIEASVGR